MKKALSVREIEALDYEQKLELFEALRLDSCLFAQTVMPHVVRSVPSFHRDLYALFDRATGPSAELSYLAAIIFRGGAKSTIKTFKTVHDVAFAQEPMILFLSESEDQSIRDLISVQDEIESNDTFRALFGDLKGNSLWNRTECEFRNGVYLGAKGWRAKIRGIKWKVQRPTKIWLDDFEGEGNTRSPEARVQVEQWIDSQVLPAGDVRPKLIFLGTIVHPDAYLAKIKDLDMFNNSRGVYYERAIAEDVSGAKPTWPERYPKEWILARMEYFKQRNRMPYFMQEYFNIPAILGDPKFKIDQIHELEGATFQKYGTVTYLKTSSNKIPINIFIGVDPAISTNTGSDRTVIFTVGILPTGDVVIIDIFADRLEITEQISKVFELSRKYGPKHVTIETYAYQRSLYEWIREEQRRRKHFFSLRKYQELRSKSNKFIEGLAPYINEGRVGYLPDADNTDLFLAEAKNFSGGQDHDDTLDGMFLALNESYAPQKYDVDARVAQMKEAAKNGKPKKKRKSWMVL